MNKLGFGFLRLPMMADGTVDQETVCQMVDAYLAGGKTYFDTAYKYLNGLSEKALGECVVKRYPRDSFQIAAKLPGYLVKSREECEKYFQEELSRCCTDYFDVYMLHWLNRKHYQIAEETGQFDFLKELKAQGRAKRIGFSFHDTADLLDEILTDHPEVDCVLLQLNYADWESPAIQSQRCYETALKHGKSIIVMEPVKGGTLAELPLDVCALMQKRFPGEVLASLALRFAESLPGVETVLSGMSTLRQINENLKDRPLLTDAEQESLLEIAKWVNHETAIPCTGCGYCLKDCPQKISIPNVFRMYNEIKRSPKDDWKIIPAYEALRSQSESPTDCIRCGKCEKRCPQQLPIRDHLKEVAAVFEKV